MLSTDFFLFSTMTDLYFELMRSDKKADHGVIDLVMADEPGKGYIRRTSLEELRGRL